MCSISEEYCTVVYTCCPALYDQPDLQKHAWFMLQSDVLCELNEQIR